MNPASNVIHFNCQTCGTLLTVPVEMAGVTGPCPHCRATITSPFPSPPAQVSPFAAPPRQQLLGGVPTPQQAMPPQHLPNPWQQPASPSPLSGTSWPPTAPVVRGSGTHPVMERLLHTQPTLPTATPPYQERSNSPPRRRSSSRSDGKRGAMWLALLMALLVVAGTSWFFRDQLKAAWLTYTMKADDPSVDTNVPSVTPPKPETGGKSPTFDPSAPALPKAIPIAQPKAPEPAPPSPPPGATASTTPPPVTVLPALPASGNVASGPGTGSLVEVPGGPTAGPPVNVVPAPPPAPPLIVGATADTKPALEALQRFFLSRKWQDRLPYVQAPASMTPLMEQYYATNPDGPLHPSHIQLIRFDKEPETGPPHCVFQVAGGGLKQPLPIMVEHAEDGWKVDWLTFTEFKDELLLRFLESPQPEPARFHVLMRRAHYFDDDVPALDKKTCFQVMPPMPGFTGDVFAIKGTPVARDLDKHLGWDVSQAAVVVELQWRQDEKSKWVELTNLVQLNWRNVEPPAPKAVPVDSEEPAPKAAS